MERLLGEYGKGTDDFNGNVQNIKKIFNKIKGKRNDLTIP
jgi:hypothetical protein